MGSYRLRRTIIVIITLLFLAVTLAQSKFEPLPVPLSSQSSGTQEARKQLDALAVKGRAPRTNYSREQFGDGWESTLGCDTRNNILRRDLKNVVTNSECKVISGTLHDPYTGKIISFTRGESTSDDVQIDHVVALSNAWQTGAQHLDYFDRVALSNDPLNLLAVDGPANEQKSDGDAATWLPPNKSFRCQYITRQVSVKTKYKLWITPPEKTAMLGILERCQP